MNHRIEFNEKSIVILFAVFAGIYLLLALIGGLNNYSPVPTADMWVSYLGFYINSQAGDHSLWLSQHNEHRIFLSKILFWLDFKLFHGQTYFLIIMNYLLAGISFYIIYSALEEILARNQDKKTQYIIGSIVVCLIFSWLQRENFIWGFQSQFFLAQLVPLSAFILLHKSYTSQNHSRGLFGIACIMGILSAGTMANGVLALPLMLLFGIILRLNKWKIALLIVLTAMTLGAYFYGYNAPKHHGSLRVALLENPFGLIQYMTLYLGGPFFRIWGESQLYFSKTIAMIATAFLIISTAYFGWKSIKSPKNASLQLALVLFILYIGGTALGTAGGRLNLGLMQAIALRYTTPALMAWSVLLVLFAPMITQKSKGSLSALLSLLIIPFVLMPQQCDALKSTQGITFEKQLAALSLELGVKDLMQFGQIGPLSDGYLNYTLDISKIAAENNLSIFNHPLIKNASKTMGTQMESQVFTLCIGAVDTIDKIDSDSKYVRVNGWIFEPVKKVIPDIVYILNSENRIIGYGLTGRQRPDLKSAIDANAELAGFTGYAFSNNVENLKNLQGSNPSCTLTRS